MSEKIETTSRIKQLVQFISGPVWDGNIIDKGSRDELFKRGYISRTEGFNFLSTQGVTLLIDLGFLKP